MMLCTLVFLVKSNEILLGMKKRGFGSGRWNGIGGKVEAGEDIERAMVRECEEEIGVTPVHYEKVAVHELLIAGEQPDIELHTYVSRGWKGEPKETDEMAPQWFKFADIPYDAMWEDDIYWLPQILEGQKLHTHFTFSEDEHMLTAKVHEAAL